MRVADPVEADAAAEEEELRGRARTLSKQIETTYWELGKAIYEVWDGCPGGRRRAAGEPEIRKGLHEKWGYASFEEYCDKEVGLKRRTASHLRYAYYWFEHKLSLPSEVKDRLKKLGRSKLYAMAGHVTEDNIISWIDKAEMMTVEDIKKTIATAKAVESRKSSEDNPHAGDDLYEYAKQDKIAADNAGGDFREAPAPEVMKTLHTSLYAGQFETWQNAFDRAKGITGSDKISHNLEMICLDFLGGNDFTTPETDVGTYLSKIERLLGLKMIAIDPQTGKPVHGQDLLWLLVQARVDSTVDPQPNGTVDPDPALVSALRLVEDEPVVEDVESDDPDDKPPAF